MPTREALAVLIWIVPLSLAVFIAWVYRPAKVIPFRSKSKDGGSFLPMKEPEK